MPSAEKVTSMAAKPESAQPIEPKPAENTQKDADEKSSSSGQLSSIQQALLIISNKVRNLEKRKNKLDGYIKDEQSGKELTSEQEKAVSKYDEVTQQLILSKEFSKQFGTIASAASKDQKREARKNLFARQIQETTKVREVLMIQELLVRLKDDKTRSDFLNARNGACGVDKVEMEFIDKFAQAVVPTRPKYSNEPSFSSSAKTSADHFSFLVDARNRQFMDTGLTYEKARDVFNRIQSCGYWEKDVKYVEVTAEESRADNDTPNTDDLEMKEEKSEDAGGDKIFSAPAPAQVPTPSFNGNVMPVQQQHQQLPRAPVARGPSQHQRAPIPAPTNGPSNMKTTVTAVENAYFNQMKFSQPPQGGPQLINNGPLPIAPVQSDFGGANFSFLQDSELDSPATPGSQQKMPVNVIQNMKQPKHSPVQHQQMQQAQQPALATQALRNSNFHPQSPIAAGQMFPPGLKVQHPMPNQPHIPVNYQPSPQLNQQNAVPSSQVPNMIPKQQQPVNGSQAVYGASSQTPPLQQQQTSRPAYPTTMVPKAQYQQQGNAQNLPNAKSIDQKPTMAQKMDGSGDSSMKSNDGAGGRNTQEKEKQREDYQQQPQIDTWTNETAAQAGGNANFSSRSSGANSNRSNRTSGGGSGGGAKYNNYRSGQQPRTYNENGSGDSPREGQAPGTFFRNNSGYNGTGTPTGGTRFEGRGGGASGNNYKPREGSYRAGSGRFAGSASASAQGSSNPGQRK